MFYAYLEQGGGCDYTIDCGKRLTKLKSETKNEALEEIKTFTIGTFIKDEGRFCDGMELDKVTLFEVINSESIPIQDWIKEAKQIEKEFASKEDEKFEAELYEKLKKKFEKS